MASINEVAASRIRALLAERGISHADFAIGVGLSDRTAARRLAGSSSWTLDELSSAARFLDIPLGSLIARADSDRSAA